MGQSLPIISIESFSTSTPESAKYQNDAFDLYAALSEIGFAIIVGHGVVDEIVANMRDAVKIVFDTPREILMQDMVVKGNYRGFVPLGYFTPNSGTGAADQYEAWKLHNETEPNDPVCEACSLYGPNGLAKMAEIFIAFLFSLGLAHLHFLAVKAVKAVTLDDGGIHPFAPENVLKRARDRGGASAAGAGDGDDGVFDRHG
mgnify:CR=1 FL=1